MISHFEELRYRLGISLMGIFIIFIVLAFFSNQCFTLLALPLIKLNNTTIALIATQITTPIWVPLQLSFMLSLFIGLPWLLYQLWCFIKPGLHPTEKKPILLYTTLGIILFYLGVALTYYGLLPITLKFIQSWIPPNVNYLPDIKDYLNFCLKLCLAGGITAEIPLITLALIKLKLTTPTQLKAARPYVVILCLTLGMLLTPPDVLSQILLAIPMYLLFELGLWLGNHQYGKKKIQPNP